MARSYVEIALLVALSFLANIFVIKLLPNGGELSLYPILLIIIVLRFGLKVAIITIVIAQVLLFFTGLAYVVSFLQWFLDYVLANVVLIFPFYFVQNKYVSFILGFLLKYVVHVISGILFFAEFTSGNLVIYSITYNLLYLIPTLILNYSCLLIINNKYQSVFKS